MIVGSPREQDQQLIATAEAALAAGIEAAKPGNKIGDISFAIARVGSQAGYKINTEFGGHGVGRTMHGDPHVPNNGPRGRGLPLPARPGDRDRAVVLSRHRQDLHRRRRLDLRGAGTAQARMPSTQLPSPHDGPLVLTAR